MLIAIPFLISTPVNAALRVPRRERGSSLESKHPCRLGGDRANRFRPPRADDHSVISN
jgi:hypothetical protein